MDAENYSDKEDQKCIFPGWFGDGNWEDFKTFSQHAHLVNLTAGTINFIIFVFVAFYIAIALLGNSKFVTTKWICLLILATTVAFVSAGELFLSKAKAKNCNYGLHMIFSVDSCLVFNVSIVIAYQVYSVTSDILEFCQKGNLPSMWSKKRNKRIVSLLWILSILILAVYIFVNSWYWFGPHQDFSLLQVVDFCFQMG